MEENLDNLFFNIREDIFKLIQEKHVNINILAFDLGISTKTFLENFNRRIEDFTFYLQTISLLENWEVE